MKHHNLMFSIVHRLGILLRLLRFRAGILMFLILWGGCACGQRSTCRSPFLTKEIFRLTSFTVFRLNGTTPFWFYSNRWGRIEKREGSGQYLIGEVYFDRSLGEKSSMAIGAEAITSNPGDAKYLNQLFLKLRYDHLELRIGKEALSIAQYSDDLSSGSMFVSKNARPVAHIGLGFYDYVILPFTNRQIVFKGAFQLGLLDDDRGQKGTDRPLLQEKFFYLKSNRQGLNFWLGINHSVLMGGTYPDGTKIPVDLWASFWGKGSPKFKQYFEGEENNAAGAHFGLFDFGGEFSRMDWKAESWYQKPIADQSGIRGIFNLKHDQILGVNVVSRSKKIINQFLFEYVKTDYQSGSGTPNLSMDGRILDIRLIEDYDSFLDENFAVETQGVSKDQFLKYLRQYLNKGEKTGGRDNYYNNWMYYKGNSYYGRSIGTPLFQTQDDKSFFNRADDFIYDGYFINNRLIAYHIGFSGWLGSYVKYRLLETFTINKGTYAGKYGGVFAWDTQTDYFFNRSKNQNYLLVELHYFLKRMPLILTSGIGWDAGKLSQSKAILFSAGWSF